MKTPPISIREARTFLAPLVPALLALACSGPPQGGSDSSGTPPSTTVDQPPLDPFAPGASLICDMPAFDGASPGPMLFVLSAMNHKLQHYPEFAATIGVQVVSNCESAQRFVEGYVEYLRDYPGFDDGEPHAPGSDEEPPRPAFDIATEPEPEVSKVGGSAAAEHLDHAVVHIEFHACAPHRDGSPRCPSAGPSWIVNGVDLRTDQTECSGTFIAKNWILTAAHCISNTAIDKCMEDGRTLSGCTPHFDNYATWQVRGTYPTSLGQDGVPSQDDTFREYSEFYLARSYIDTDWLGKRLSNNPETCSGTNCYDSRLGANHDLALLYIEPDNDYRLPPRTDDGAAKRLSVVSPPDKTWSMALAGWGLPQGDMGRPETVLRRGNLNSSIVDFPTSSSDGSPGQRMVVTGNYANAVAYACPGDSGGPVVRQDLRMMTNRGERTGLDAIVAVVSASNMHCVIGPEPDPSFEWLATRVDTPEHQKFITDSFKRWPASGKQTCFQRQLIPSSGKMEVQECWGTPCSGICSNMNDECLGSPREIQNILVGKTHPEGGPAQCDCSAFAPTPPANNQNQGCNCIDGQCLPKK